MSPAEGIVFSLKYILGGNRQGGEKIIHVLVEGIVFLLKYILGGIRQEVKL